MEELYRQEIIELTELLNTDENWADLKSILISAGIDLSKTVLASFMEDDEENEYGVIVSKHLTIHSYSRNINIGNLELTDITQNKDELSKYPQVAIAVKMIKNGEIL